MARAAGGLVHQFAQGRRSTRQGRGSGRARCLRDDSPRHLRGLRGTVQPGRTGRPSRNSCCAATNSCSATTTCGHTTGAASATLLVDEFQDTNTIPVRLAARACRGRAGQRGWDRVRSGPWATTISRSTVGGAPRSRTSTTSRPTSRMSRSSGLEQNYRSTRSYPGSCQYADRQQRGASRQEPVDRCGRRWADPGVLRLQRPRRGPVRCRSRPALDRGWRQRRRHRRAVPVERPVPGHRGGLSAA